MRIVIIFFMNFFLFTYTQFAQSQIEDDVETATINAKKGIYWALSNLSGKKAKIDKSIIGDDKLIAKVKAVKEINGVKIESTGYYQTNEVTIVLYRSRESLMKDGYIKKGELESYSDDE